MQPSIQSPPLIEKEAVRVKAIEITKTKDTYYFLKHHKSKIKLIVDYDIPKSTKNQVFSMNFAWNIKKNDWNN